MIIKKDEDDFRTREGSKGNLRFPLYGTNTTVNGHSCDKGSIVNITTRS